MYTSILKLKMEITLNELEAQFNDEPITAKPDPNKEYYYCLSGKATGFNYLMKLVLLTKNILN